VRIVAEEGFEGVAEGLAALVESGLDDLSETGFVARQTGTAVASEANNGALDLGRGRENIFIDGEKIFDIIPYLDEYAEYTVSTVTVRCGKALGDLALYHTGTTGNAVSLFDEFEEYLGGDIIGVIAGEAENGSRETGSEVHTEEVLDKDTPFEGWKQTAETVGQSTVNLDDGEVVTGFKEVAGECTFAGAYLKDGITTVTIKGIGYTAGDAFVTEEMLSEGFLGHEAKVYLFRYIQIR
jgi:hypothetical protein